MNIKNYIKNTTLLHLILATFRSIWSKDTQVRKIPQRIGEYELEKILTKENPYLNYFVGLYKNKGKQYVLKTWQGKRLDLYLLKLIHELHVNLFLTQKFQMKKLTSRQCIFIPKIVEYKVYKNSLSLVFEYVKGTLLSKESTEKQARTISDIAVFFITLTRKLTHQEIKSFPQRTLRFYIFSLPLIVIFSLLRDVQNYRQVILYLYKCLMSIGSLKKLPLVLAHRDLIPKNILCTKNGICLIDFEHMVLTYPGYDLIYLSVYPEFTELSRRLSQILKYKHDNFLKFYISIQFAHAVFRPQAQPGVRKIYA